MYEYIACGIVVMLALGFAYLLINTMKTGSTDLEK